MTQASTARGALIAIGGAEDKTSSSEILGRVLQMTASDNRTVGVITTASSIPDEVFPPYETVFTEMGATAVHHLNIREREDSADPANVELMRGCGLIFLSGGDQLRLTHVLGGSPMLRALRECREQGTVIAGTSAGAAAQSGTMIYGGGSADSLRKGAVRMSPGLGLVNGIVIDSHFLERGRFTRLIAAGASNPEFLGIGISEDAAVIFHNGTLEALGPGHVVIVDSQDLGHSNVAALNDDEPMAVENVTIHVLISGYGYDVPGRRLLQPAEVGVTEKEAAVADT